MSSFGSFCRVMGSCGGRSEKMGDGWILLRVLSSISGNLEGPASALPHAYGDRKVAGLLMDAPKWHDGDEEGEEVGEEARNTVGGSSRAK